MSYRFHRFPIGSRNRSALSAYRFPLGAPPLRGGPKGTDTGGPRWDRPYRYMTTGTDSEVLP